MKFKSTLARTMLTVGATAFTEQAVKGEIFWTLICAPAVPIACVGYSMTA
ncbi:MAG: hypothetical protein LKI93_05100 [Bifidobacteriaceae bacterium]|nr:hypothetical protein [Bifidobacteriaceae bacterium]MCI1915360.1 hypothetical protein [Bifidobacteriaceae bacterium]